MIFIGVDPGKEGGYAVMFPYGVISCRAWDNDGFVRIMRMVAMRNDSKAIACVEKVGSKTGEGVTSTFNFGKAAGFIEGVLTSCEIPHQLVPPRTWKGEFGLNSDKANSVEVCKRLFPTVNLKRTERCKKDHDGMAEALLMAEYARRKWGVRNENGTT